MIAAARSSGRGDPGDCRLSRCEDELSIPIAAGDRKVVVRSCGFTAEWAMAARLKSNEPTAGTRHASRMCPTFSSKLQARISGPSRRKSWPDQ